VYKLLGDIRKALKHLMSLSIWHNDVKLENIGFLSNKDGEKTWKLFDFGIATESPFGIDELKGSPGYISTFRLDPGKDEYGDAWSLFVVWLILRLNMKPANVFETLGLRTSGTNNPHIMILRTLYGCTRDHLQSILQYLRSTGEQAYAEEEQHLESILSTFIFQRLGLRWYDTPKPDDGDELKNDMLSKMLLKKQDFTEEEFATFQLGHFHEAQYVKAGDKFFKPMNYRQMAHTSYKMLMSQFLSTCGPRLLEYTPKRRNHGV
jgi:serine/threonine protein kinase